MSDDNQYLMSSDIYKFLQCPHWPYFDRYATAEDVKTRRTLTDIELKRLEHTVADELIFAERFYAGKRIVHASQTGKVLQDTEKTAQLMREGAEVIYRPTLFHGTWAATPDLLEKHEGASAFGAWYYAPVDLKSTHTVEKYQRLQFVMYATLLERMQGFFPPYGSIYTCDGERLTWSISESIAEWKVLMDELERSIEGERPLPVLRKSCFDTGPWGVSCQRLAEAHHDIALLANIDLKKMTALRQLGISTLEQVAVMEPAELDGAAPGLRAHGLSVLRTQAQSLLDGSVTIREPVALPLDGVEIFFDIESDPLHDRDYLYGFWMRSPEGTYYHCFSAHRLEEEEAMWRAFLAWIETLPAEYTVYHFASYERERLTLLEHRYGATPWLDKFRSHMIDLKDLTLSSVVLPLYFYGLKYLGAFLGYHWDGVVKGGGQSVDVFETYLQNGDMTLFESIKKYNEDDVRATAVLKDWLATYARERKTYHRPYPWS